MNEEQMKNLLESISSLIEKRISAYDEKRKEEDTKRKSEEESKKKSDEVDSLKQAEEEVKKRHAAKNAEDLEKERFLEAFKWNSTIKDYLKDNKEYLPENLEDIINILSAKTYANDIEKAQELKRAVVEQYIKSQENLDILPDSLKAKAEKYAGFTTKEKLDRALDYYDIVETGIHTAKNIKKAEAIEKSGGIPSAERDVIKEYEDKMLKFSQDTIADTNNGSK